MILSLEVLTACAVILGGPLWLLFRGPSPAARYARCLSNTARLERELFPEWFPSPLETLIGPGQRWIVQGRDSIAMLPDAVAQKRAVQAELLYGAPGRPRVQHVSLSAGSF